MNSSKILRGEFVVMIDDVVPKRKSGSGTTSSLVVCPFTVSFRVLQYTHHPVNVLVQWTYGLTLSRGITINSKHAGPARRFHVYL